MICLGPDESAELYACDSAPVTCPDRQVDRVHVGGSFGRRTSVRGCFDVDLLVFINDLDTSYEHRVYNLLDFVSLGQADNLWRQETAYSVSWNRTAPILS